MSPRSPRYSVASFTFATKAEARADHSGSSFRSQPYSFVAAPHPAAFTITASTADRSNAAMLRRARSRARSRAPVRKEPVERCRANETLEGRSRTRGDDLRARPLDELAVFDAGGAGRFAGASVQAFGDVILKPR